MLTQTYPRFEGDTAGTFIQSLAHALAVGGDEVHVLLPHDRALEERPAPPGLTVHSFRYAPTDNLHTLGYSRTMDRDVHLRMRAALLGPFYTLAAARALSRLIRRVKPDVTQAHWLVPNGVVAAAVKKTPLVVSLHGTDVYMAEKRFMRPAARFALGRTDALTGSSQDLVDRALAVRRAPRARFIPYGVDPVRFDGKDPRKASVRAALRVPTGSSLILAVGRMVPKKGFDVLIEALARLDDTGWVAVLAGEGSDLESLRARANALGLGERMRYPGGVAHDELPAYYSAADVFVMPSVRDRAGNVDGLPNVVLEAMASGTAVVASSIGGIPAVITDGATGLLIPERDENALAEGLARLLNSPDERASLGAAARRKVQAELTWQVVARHYRDSFVDACTAP
jgi:glycosyltransferase involved in cell wall biosynthesis